MKKQRAGTPQPSKSFLLAVFFALASIIGQAQPITLLAPNGGEVWFVYSTEDVSWTGQDLGNLLQLEFSPDGGVSWWPFGQVPSSPNGGSAQIFVPSYLSTNALLKITDLGNPDISDISDAPFTITYPPISIWEPNFYSVVFSNDLTYVNWTIFQQGITLLNAEISTDNGQTYTPIAQNLNALGGFAYLVLSESPANACILKLYDAENPSTFALSQVFVIRPVPVYTLTSPVEGQIVNTNSFLTISWNVQNPYAPENYFEFSSDNGQTWEYIGSGNSQGTSGSFIWYTPNVNSEECLIRINDIYSGSSFDVSDVFTILPYPETPICMVTVDSLTNQNVIIWEKPDSELIADFLVYKETDEFNVYEVIDIVSYQDASIATDFDSNPEIRPYRYKIGFRDSTNRVFPLSDYHQTIHLTINQGVNDNWNLIWTPYAGFEYNSYTIMRKSGNNPYEQIASISSSFTSYTDFNAPSGDIAYMIKIANPNGCNTGFRNAIYTDVYSNQASVNVVSVNAISKTSLNIYPIPAKDHINVQFGEDIQGAINLTIIDFTGRVIHAADYSGTSVEALLPINTSALSDGVYLLKVETAGGKLTKKFVIRN